MKAHALAAAAAFILACSAGALAQDAPGLAGRVALVQGEVSVGGSVEAGPATVNWPVSSGMQFTTASGARTELRVGSTSIRLDGDSSLEVSQLDDEHLYVRLFYGSAAVRLRDRGLVNQFQLATAQGTVRLVEPGRIRVDADRTPDTTVLSVFDGVAMVDGFGNSLTVHAGRRAELRDDDVRTALVFRDAFDDWSLLRDQREDRAVAVRYIPAEMTGWEDLDANGDWRDSGDYGTLWIPRAIPVGWVPYRDGRWAWIEPWGWTWVDNAPWGYAPFHYGRWVYVDNRWCWAPGRYRHEHPVWAPALVGWVGGANWRLTFGGGHHVLPAQGWYPLAPHEHYVPNYRVRPEHLHVINSVVPSGKWPHHDARPQGLTVVPQESFEHHGVVNVRDTAHAAVPTAAVLTAQVAAPAQPPRPAVAAPAGPLPSRRLPVEAAAAAAAAQPVPAARPAVVPAPPLLSAPHVNPHRAARIDEETGERVRIPRPVPAPMMAAPAVPAPAQLHPAPAPVAAPAPAPAPAPAQVHPAPAPVAAPAPAPAPHPPAAGAAPAREEQHGHRPNERKDER
ncbi:MAG: DUF6600 domain-containing protein [Telluria sp.]